MMIMTQDTWPPCPASIQTQLEQLIAEIHSYLASGLVGIYLHGSLAMGCFNPNRSDLDLLVITRQGMAVETKRTMAQLLLQLSGQRTRITWGLSFGELKAAAIEGSVAGSAARTAPPSAEGRGPRARKAALALLLVLLPLALFALVVSVSQRANRDSADAAPGAAPAKMPASVAPAPPVGRESARSDATPFAPEVVPVASPGLPVSRLRQRVFAARARARTVTQEESPEWALPSSAQPARPNENKPPPGTNGAPIFD